MNPGEDVFNLIDDLKAEITYLREETKELRVAIDRINKTTIEVRTLVDWSDLNNAIRAVWRRAARTG